MTITPPDPGTMTSAGHHKVLGLQFNSYSVGVLRYAMMTIDGRGWVQQTRAGRNADHAKVDGKYLKGSGGKPKRFRTKESAMRAAATALNEAARKATPT